MTVKSLKDEDNLPIKQIIKAINRKMAEVIRVVDALNLGRTEVKQMAFIEHLTMESQC